MMGKGQQTRAMILERAAQLFSRQGYFGSSMSDVMRATGLQKGGIYNHFTDKDALALETFDYAFGLLWARIEREQTDSARALDELHGLVNVFRSLIQDPLLVGGCPLLNTAVEADDAHPALRRRVRQAMTQLRERIQRAVMRGIAGGEIRPDVDGDAVATLLIATMEGAVMLSKLYRDPAHMSRAADHITWYLDTLLRT
jgi:TetR/AcrR family transcriptional regulator, transcriptional repressor for nem operon